MRAGMRFLSTRLLGAARLSAVVVGAAHALSGSRLTHAQTPAAAVSMSSATANPLLDRYFFPRFADVKPEHVTPALEAALAEASAQLDKLEAEVEAELSSGRTPPYALLADGLELLEECYAGPWRTVSHLKATKDCEALRTAHAAAQPKVVEFDSRLGQSKALYRGWERLKADGAAWAALSPTQRRVAELALLNAQLAGVGLEGERKARFNEIEQELASISTTFNNNLLDSTKAFSLRLDRKEQVAGLPPSALSLLSASARAKGDAGASADEGPWLVTLDAPSLLSVLRFADDRALRETVYRAYITRASELAADVPQPARGAQDNGPLVEKILQLRAERAALLGRASHAEVSVASKMATVDGAKALLAQLLDKSLEAARAEHAALCAFAGGKALVQWDVAYEAERLKKERFGFDEEAVRQYLPLERVFAGLFGLVEKLFDVTIAQVPPEAVGAQLWDPSVKLLEVRRDGKPAAYIFVDPFARAAEKRGGAWMSQVRQRSRALSLDGGKTPCLPVAHIVCNQSPPTVGPDGAQVPSLMSFSECRTLFHETGHALQHVLTQVDEGHVSGIAGVEWDAVEQPSQWMENWLEQPAVLRTLAVHWQTNEPIPAELIAKIKASNTFRAASAMVRQVKLALTDLELHSGFVPGAEGERRTVRDVEAEVEARASILPPLPDDRFLCSFRHIWAGGYSAGYYSCAAPPAARLPVRTAARALPAHASFSPRAAPRRYKWAEVLSADGFGAFEEAGLDDDEAVRALGRKYAQTVMGLGGSKPASEVFLEFRGREPQVDALLRHNDLLPGKPGAAAAVAA